MPSPQPEDVVREEAYVPIYDSVSMFQIKALPPQPVLKGGKIYVWGNYLFQVEQVKGVHIFNYADRKNPVKIGFIQSRGCNEVAAKGNYLIVNNMSDLVMIDVSKPDDVKEVGRVRKVFYNYYYDYIGYPQPPTSGYRVCPDFNKGDIVGWTLEKNVRGAYCR